MTVVICKNGDRYGCKLGPEETLELTKKGRVRFARDGAVSTIKLDASGLAICLAWRRGVDRVHAGDEGRELKCFQRVHQNELERVVRLTAKINELRGSGRGTWDARWTRDLRSLRAKLRGEEHR